MASRKTTPGQFSMALYSFADDEFLATLRDNEEGDDGWISSNDLAEAIFGPVGKKEQADRNRCVGARLGWMRKFGCVERNEEGGPNRNKWRLSEMGLALVNAKLKGTLSSQLLEMPETQLFQANLVLSSRFSQIGDTTFAVSRRAYMAAFYRRRMDRR